MKKTKENSSRLMAREVVFPVAWQDTQLCHEGQPGCFHGLA